MTVTCKLLEITQHSRYRFRPTYRHRWRVHREGGAIALLQHAESIFQSWSQNKGTHLWVGNTWQWCARARPPYCRSQAARQSPSRIWDSGITVNHWRAWIMLSNAFCYVLLMIFLSWQAKILCLHWQQKCLRYTRLCSRPYTWALPWTSLGTSQTPCRMRRHWYCGCLEID